MQWAPGSSFFFFVCVCVCVCVFLHHLVPRLLGKSHFLLERKTMSRNIFFLSQSLINNVLKIANGTHDIIRSNSPPVLLKSKSSTFLENKIYESH